MLLLGYSKGKAHKIAGIAAPISVPMCGGGTDRRMARTSAGYGRAPPSPSPPLLCAAHLSVPGTLSSLLSSPLPSPIPAYVSAGALCGAVPRSWYRAHSRFYSAPRFESRQRESPARTSVASRAVESQSRAHSNTLACAIPSYDTRQPTTCLLAGQPGRTVSAVSAPPPLSSSLSLSPPSPPTSPASCGPTEPRRPCRALTLCLGTPADKRAPKPAWTASCVVPITGGVHQSRGSSGGGSFSPSSPTTGD